MRLSAGVAIAVAALFLTGVGGAADFTDPVGDTYGPDIDKVTIAERPGCLDVTVHVADHPELAEDEIVEVDIDTDANDQTGDGGIDVYGVVQGQEDANRQNFIVSEVLKYDKAVDDYVDTDAAKIDFDNGTATLAVPLSLVGAHTVRIAVSAIAAPLPEPPDPNNPPPPPTKPDTDYAPDTGVYTFTLATPTLRQAAVTYQPAAQGAACLGDALVGRAVLGHAGVHGNAGRQEARHDERMHLAPAEERKGQEPPRLSRRDLRGDDVQAARTDVPRPLALPPDRGPEERVLAQRGTAVLALHREGRREGGIAGGAAADDLAAALRANGRHFGLELLEPADDEAAREAERGPVPEHLPALLAQPLRRLSHRSHPRQAAPTQGRRTDIEGRCL
jgi:hypothetical protein